MEFVTAILLPIGAVYGLIASFRVARWAGEQRDRLHAAGPEPIERLAAYLDALRTACQRLEVTPPRVTGPPGNPQASQAEIYRVESDLRRRGLDVRELAEH